MPDAHAPLPALAVGYRLPDPAADLDAYLGHALLGSVLGDGEAARLQRRLVHVDGLVTDVSAGAGLMGPLDARDPDTFTITAVHPAAVDPDRVLAAVDEELDKLAAAGPDRRGAGPPGRALVRGAAPGERPGDVPDARPRRPRAALRPRGDRAWSCRSGSPPSRPSRSRAAAAALRGGGRGVLLVEPGTQPAEEQA